MRRAAFLLVAAALAASQACQGQGGGGATSNRPPGTGGGDGGGGGDAGPDYVVETCEGAPAATPGEDVCAVTAGDARLWVAGDVLTPGVVYAGGGVLLDAGGAIRCAGCGCAAEAQGATQVVCPDAVISAGLINAHDHVGWMNGVPWVAADEGVDSALRWEHRHDWRKGLRSNPKITVSGGSASRSEKIYGELRFALSGATAIFGSGDLGGVLRDLDATGSGDNGLGQPGASYDTFPLGDSSGTQSESGCSSYAPPDPAGAIVDCYAPHVAEGIDAVARNEFHCLTGQGSGSKVSLDHRSAIIHGIGLGPADIALMANQGMRLIWTPRSNISLYGDTAPVTVYHALGVSIGLGTDWLPSGSMNMLRELHCAASFNRDFLGGYFSDHQLWQMATVGSARALAFDDVTGVLAAGHAGDLAVYAKNGREHYTAVVDARVEDLALVLRGGRVLTGNANVVAALEPGCDALDVCGVQKQVCLSRDTGMTLAALEAEVQGAYPLFFCDTPDDEPSCLPARAHASDTVAGSNNYSGMSMAGDQDGDGLADGDDNCATVFNPIRPLDGGVQADHDGDGDGDACDPCPLDAGVTDCASGGDIDGDGVLDADDNCVSVDNPDQLDGDGDLKGDACDDCPQDPNPGAAACPGEETTIMAIQDPTHAMHPNEGERVRVTCIVTALGTNMVWCQDAAGGPYSGIAIYLGGATKTYAGGGDLALGDVMTVDGDYTEYFDLTQLENPVFTFVQSGAVPAPVTLTAAQLASGTTAESYEGVLVRVTDVSVSDVNPDAPSDFDEFMVSGLRIDDACIDGGGTGGLLDNSYTLGQSFSAITGVHHYSFDNYKLLPRMLSDIQM